MQASEHHVKKVQVMFTRFLKPIFGLLAVSTFVLFGCSPTPPPQVAQNNNANSRGNSNNSSDDEDGDGDQSSQVAKAPAKQAAPEPEYRMIGGKMRRMPVAAAGDGPPIARQNTPPAAGAQNNSNSAASGGAGMVAGMANGLFPAMGGGGSGTSMVAGFGALFPTGESGGSSSSSSSSPRRNETPSTSSAVTPPVVANNIPSFLDIASASFARGDATNAHRALYAYALLNPSTFDEFPLHYVPHLEEPRWFLNWGVGVQYSPVKEFSGFPPLIGDEVESSSTTRQSADILGVDPLSGGVSGMTASKSKYGNINVSVPVGMLIYYTGDYGVRLYKRMNERREGEFFGKILANLPEHQPGEGEGGVANLAPNAGEASTVSRHAFRNRPVAAAGDGPATPPPDTDNNSAGPGNPGAGRPAGAAKTSVLQRWSVKEEAKEPGSITGLIMPGVVSVGEGKSEILIERAKKQGLDALIIMEVKVLKEKNTFYSSTVLRIYDLKDDSKKWVANAKALRNNLVAKDREKTRESNDPVELELDKVFREFVDENLKVQPLQGWDAARASQYVDSLIESKADPLRAATETLGLYRMGILQADKCKSALDELLGGAGTVLMSGKESDKQQFLRDFVKDSGGASGGIR
jgi:hypothetical protein